MDYQVIGKQASLHSWFVFSIADPEKLSGARVKPLGVGQPSEALLQGLA
jgi:hypothetical protein